MAPKYDLAARVFVCIVQDLRQSMYEEIIVAQHHRLGCALQETISQKIGLRQTIGGQLHKLVSEIFHWLPSPSVR